MAKAKRIAFLAVQNWVEGQPAFIERVVEFEWAMGQNFSKRQVSYLNMHDALIRDNFVPLEISTKSKDYEFGKEMSAFNLSLNGYAVENIFQSYKVFNDGGPYLNLLQVSPVQAKNSCCIQTRGSKKGCSNNKVEYENLDFYHLSTICEYCQKRPHRHLVGFSNKKETWSSEPKSMFFDSIYITALIDNPNLSEALLNFNAFTDIEFNQKEIYSKEKGPFNCQARSCAIYVSMRNSGMDNDEILSIVSRDSTASNLYYSNISKSRKDRQEQITFKL